jgi:metacaspase-1
MANNPVLVYVHGVCKLTRGYSDPWWAALSPFAASLQDGDLGEPGGTTSKRYEVFWSDLVRSGSRGVATPSPARTGDHEQTLQRLVEIIEDRARQQAMTWAGAQPSANRALETATLDPAAHLMIFLDCVTDFVQYLEEPAIRQQVQGRFFEVVSPLLESGAEIHLISHSWGTVVAYESLCLLETVTPQPPGVIANLFLVGSALSISPVRSRLIDLARDGHRPRMVRRCLNLDARGDIVGGPLKVVSFGVDQEFLNLPPVGCNSSHPDPACAHGSYFDAQNLATNRDIFGRFIAT